MQNLTSNIDLKNITLDSINNLLFSQVIYFNYSYNFCNIQYIIVRNDFKSVGTSLVIYLENNTKPNNHFIEINWKSGILWITILSIVVCCFCSCIVKYTKKSKKIIYTEKEKIKI